MPKHTIKRELSTTVPSTTQLKLFDYPEKFGGHSYCVGFERHIEDGEGHEFVSQSYLTEWTEDYESQLEAFNGWKYILGVD